MIFFFSNIELRLINISSDSNNIVKTIEEKEELIEELRGQLKQAGDDLTKSTAALQEFKKTSETK